eukprot:scaffold741_cov303-Prasinococcus_capsulatus_cf.AAC.1
MALVVRGGGGGTRAAGAETDADGREACRVLACGAHAGPARAGAAAAGGGAPAGARRRLAHHQRRRAARLRARPLGQARADAAPAARPRPP